MNENWQKAQEQELNFWRADWDFPVLYRKKYGIFLKEIEKLPKKIRILDIGCGAFTFSGMFGFRNLWLVDSLIGKYRTCKNNLSNSVAQISRNAEYVLPFFRKKMFGGIFFLNCADHIDPKALTIIFNCLSRVCYGSIFFYSDFREKKEDCDDCHPFIFTKDDFERFTKDFDKEFCFFGKSNEKNLDAVWAILKPKVFGKLNETKNI